MKCPKCEKQMILKNEDISLNATSKKEYCRRVFWCEVDDVWVVTEIPKENNGESK